MGLKARLDERPLGGAQIRIVILMMILLMFEGLDIQLLGLMAPVILEDWGVDRATFGPAMAAALVGLSIGAGIGGRLGDIFGRKTVLMASAAIFSLATAAAGFADDVTQMTAIRFISGLGFGAASPVTLTLVAEWLPRRAQPVAISLMSVGVPLGGMVGSLLLIPLVGLLGWRGCFIAFGILTALLALIVYALLPESPVWLIARGRIGDALALLRRHIDNALGEADLQPDAVPVAFAEPGRDGIGMIFRPPLWRLTAGSWLLFFTGQFIAYSLISWSTTFLTLAHFSMDQALQGNFAFNVCAVIATLGAGLLIGWFGSRRVLLVATLLSLVSLIALISVLGGLEGAPGPVVFWLVLVAVAGVGLFDSMAIATGYAVMTMGYPETVRSTGLGITLMIGRSGGMLTGLIGGWLLSLSGDEAWPMLALLIALSFGTLVATFVIDRHIGARKMAAD